MRTGRVTTGTRSARGSANSVNTTRLANSTPHGPPPWTRSASNGSLTRRCGSVASPPPPPTTPARATSGYPTSTLRSTATAWVSSSSPNACSTNAAPSHLTASPPWRPSASSGTLATVPSPLGWPPPARHYRANGNLFVASTYRTADGYGLGRWFQQQRRRLRDNKLADDRIRALDELSPSFRTR
jgi:hypothetical protein